MFYWFRSVRPELKRKLIYFGDIMSFLWKKREKNEHRKCSRIRRFMWLSRHWFAIPNHLSQIHSVFYRSISGESIPASGCIAPIVNVSWMERSTRFSYQNFRAYSILYFFFSIFVNFQRTNIHINIQIDTKLM